MVMPQQPQPQPQPAEGGDAAQGQVGQLVNDIGKGLTMFTEMVVQSGAPEPTQQKAQQLVSMFSEIISELSGGAQAEPAQGAVAPEMGGAPGAMPAGPQGV